MNAAEVILAHKQFMDAILAAPRVPAYLHADSRGKPLHGPECSACNEYRAAWDEVERRRDEYRKSAGLPT